MTYLLTHLAVYLVFADLLGLALGWLLWGYIARQRGREVMDLRSRLSDMQVLGARVRPAGLPSFHPAPAPLTVEAPAPVPTPRLDVAPSFGSDNLEDEVRAARIQFLQERVRKLESTAAQSANLQNELTAAMADHRTAVEQAAALKADMERARADWSRERDLLNQATVEKDKELAHMRGELLEMQNSRQPIETGPVGPAADLTRLQNEIKMRDERHVEQTKQIERLLWRVAELEPQADNASKLQDELSRKDAEIAGHLALHAEASDQARLLQAKAEQSQARAADLEKQLGDGEAARRRAAALTDTLSARDAEIAALLSAHSDMHSDLEDAQKAMADLESRLGAVTFANANKDAQISSLTEEAVEAHAQWANREKALGGELARLKATVTQRDKLFRRGWALSRNS